MVNSAFKKQKLNQFNKVNGVIPKTQFRLSLVNFKSLPSSVLNGFLENNEMYSLSFKSLICAIYVMNNDLIRSVLFNNKQIVDTINFCNDEIDLNKKIKELEKEIEQIQNEIPKTSYCVSSINEQKIYDSLSTSKDLIDNDYFNIIKTDYEKSSNKKILLSNSRYSLKKLENLTS